MTDSTTLDAPITDNLFSGCGVEILLKEEDDFLKVRETLTRIGIPSYKDRKLYQSCHLLHKRGRYVIIHFLELFVLDGKKSTFGDEDRIRRNAIVNLLEEWGLLTIIPSEKIRIADDSDTDVRIKILSHKDKVNWELVRKHGIGNDR